MATTQRTQEITVRSLSDTGQLQRQLERVLGPLFRWLIYFLIVVIFLTPFVWMIFGSLRPHTELFHYAVPLQWRTFIPEVWTFQYYLDVFGISELGQARGLNFGRALLNSALVSTAVVVSSLIFNTMGAYFFARMEFPYKNLLMIFVIGTMLVPLEATMVPLYIVVREMGFANTYWALILPWYASPFIIFALAQFFKDIPKDLDEAAIIDGAGQLGVLRHVIIPNSLPGLLTVSLLEFQFIWNLFYWPLIAVGRKELQVIQVAIATQTTQRETAWGRIFAGCVIASVPVILLFLALQRYYERGIVMSGLKG